MLDTASPAGIVSVTVTFEPTGRLGPSTQVPPGAGPARTVIVLEPAANVNGVPTVTPGPAALQILRRPEVSPQPPGLMHMLSYPASSLGSEVQSIGSWTAVTAWIIVFQFAL